MEREVDRLIMVEPPTNTQDQIGLLRFGRDDPNHPLNHTRTKRESLKRTLPPEKFEQLMRLAYSDDRPPTINGDHDSGNAMHEEGMN